MENKKKNSIAVTLVLILAILVLIGVVGLDVYLRATNKENPIKLENKKHNDIVLTDTPITEAVGNIYNATVIVKVSANNNQQGWGSGFVYKIEGGKAYILTNHHVVSGMTKIDVEFTNGTDMSATLVGSDVYHDVAVVTVKSEDWMEIATIGASNELKVGDTIFTVGTPVSLDYSFTVTRGILSGKNRLVQFTDDNKKYDFGFGSKVSDSWYMSLLQVDASINSGNSGGPLANEVGAVVGITNSKLSSSYNQTSIENIGFAIPIEDAMYVAEQIENGKIDSVKPMLGISMTTVEGAEQNGITVDKNIKKGAVVQEVSVGSNAARAGLKAGDVITEFNGNSIDDYRYLKYYLYKCSIGDKVTFKYIRDGKEHTTEVVLKG